MKKRKQYTICLIAFIILIVKIQPVFAIEYNLTTFDIPGSIETKIIGINDAGQFVGLYHPNTDWWEHYGFSSNGSGYTHVEYPFGYDTWATGINDNGLIVGRSAYTGFKYDGATYTPILVPNSLSTVAWDVNDSGNIVGRYRDSNGDYRSFLYDGTSYQTLSSELGDVFGINDAGDMVGVYAYEVGGSWFNKGRLFDGNEYTDIIFPGSVLTNAYGINDAGQVVGEYGDTNGTHGFLYDINTSTYQPIDFAGAVWTSIESINDAGKIVGGYKDVNGQYHGFVGTVVPEPISSVLFVTGGAVLAGRRYLKRKRIS